MPCRALGFGVVAWSLHDHLPRFVVEGIEQMDLSELAALAQAKAKLEQRPQGA